MAETEFNPPSFVALPGAFQDFKFVQGAQPTTNPPPSPQFHHKPSERVLLCLWSSNSFCYRYLSAYIATNSATPSYLTAHVKAAHREQRRRQDSVDETVAVEPTKHKRYRRHPQRREIQQAAALYTIERAPATINNNKRSGRPRGPGERARQDKDEDRELII